MRCLNGTPHEHETVTQSKLCWARKYGTPVAAQVIRNSGSLAITKTSKLEMVVPLLSVVPDGYFAVQLDTNSKMHFVRLSTVVRKDSPKLGYRRIQTIHGPDLDLAAEINLDGKVREYKDITDTIMLIIANYQGAALRYAKEIGKCCRCNTRLTSDWRKVGIGPECVKHWPWVLERANERAQEEQS